MNPPLDCLQHQRRRSVLAVRFSHVSNDDVRVILIDRFGYDDH